MNWAVRDVPTNPQFKKKVTPNHFKFKGKFQHKIQSKSAWVVRNVPTNLQLEIDREGFSES